MSTGQKMCVCVRVRMSEKEKERGLKTEAKGRKLLMFNGVCNGQSIFDKCVP